MGEVEVLEKAVGVGRANPCPEGRNKSPKPIGTAGWAYARHGMGGGGGSNPA